MSCAAVHRSSPFSLQCSFNPKFCGLQCAQRHAQASGENGGGDVRQDLQPKNRWVLGQRAKTDCVWCVHSVPIFFASIVSGGSGGGGGEYGSPFWIISPSSCASRSSHRAPILAPFEVATKPLRELAWAHGFRSVSMSLLKKSGNDAYQILIHFLSQWLELSFVELCAFQVLLQMWNFPVAISLPGMNCDRQRICCSCSTVTKRSLCGISHSKKELVVRVTLPFHEQSRSKCSQAETVALFPFALQLDFEVWCEPWASRSDLSRSTWILKHWSKFGKEMLCAFCSDPDSSNQCVKEECAS